MKSIQEGGRRESGEEDNYLIGQVVLEWPLVGLFKRVKEGPKVIGICVEVTNTGIRLDNGKEINYNYGSLLPPRYFLQENDPSEFDFLIEGGLFRKVCELFTNSVKSVKVENPYYRKSLK